MQQDHGMLMRAAAEHDINHVLLGHAVTLIEANMDPGVAQETISLIHAAISPGHVVLRARAAAAAVPAADEQEPEAAAEAAPAEEAAAEREPIDEPTDAAPVKAERKPRTPRKPKA